MGKIIRCSKCFYPFKYNYTLRRHYRTCHPTLEPPQSLTCTSEDRNTSNQTSSLKSGGSKFKCKECKSKFTFEKNLIAHVKKFHSAQILPSALLRNAKNFKCTECAAKYTTNKHLKRHMHLKHDSFVVKNVSTVNCSLCATSFTQKDDLFQHWKFDHSISIDIEEHKFENKDMFLLWKNNVETNTRSKFVRNIPGFSTSTGITFHFHCNRSGYYNSKSRGLRYLKTQGTCKINSICPARMKVRVLENDEHVVQFTKTHVGHSHDLGHITLSKYQRDILATKIISNIPFDEILNDVRESTEFNSTYGRIHLLTRKDLHNIKQSIELLPKEDIDQTETDVLSEINDVEENSLTHKKEDEVDFATSGSPTATEVVSEEIMKIDVND